MLDLKQKSLPNALEARGQAFLLNTDFRVWLDYPRLITEDPGAFFADWAPIFTQEVADQLDLFYNPPRDVPRGSGSGAPLVDWEVDADLIYAAFLQAYGIDLLTADLHWHKFKSLFDALPDDTLMVKVIRWRSYKGSDKDMLELKNTWALPEKLTEEEQQAVDEFNELFG